MMMWTRLAPVALIATAIAVPAQAQKLRDGNDWMQASEEQRLAYMAGVSDMISAGARYDERNASAAPRTFLRQAQSALASTTMDQGIQAVTAWYRANPNQMSKPVLSVVWRELAMPRLSGR